MFVIQAQYQCVMSPTANCNWNTMQSERYAHEHFLFCDLQYTTIHTQLFNYATIHTQTYTTDRLYACSI